MCSESVSFIYIQLLLYTLAYPKFLKPVLSKEGSLRNKIKGPAKILHGTSKFLTLYLTAPIATAMAIRALIPRKYKYYVPTPLLVPIRSVDRWISENLVNYDIPIIEKEADPTEPQVVNARSAAGYNNNLACPFSGTTNQEFYNQLGKNSISYTQSSSFVAETLLRRTNELLVPKNGPNMLSMAWIQFMTHDWFAHKMAHEKYDNGLNKDYKYDGSENAVNQTCAFWQGSQIYGNTEQERNRIRTNVNGKIRLPCELNELCVGVKDNHWFWDSCVVLFVCI